MIHDYIVRLKPYCKETIWGGNKLYKKYGKGNCKETIGESWEVSTQKKQESLVESGEFKGTLFSVYLHTIEKIYWGEILLNSRNFPMLVKFIDAKECLSVQVHPRGVVFRDEMKNEIWYVMEAEENGYVYIGLNEDKTETEIREIIDSGKICDVLNKIYVKQGDVLVIPSGVIHAIGKGCLICEIQDNVNRTFRIYDYERTDVNGNQRALSVDNALHEMILDKSNRECFIRSLENGILCSQFSLDEISVDKRVCFSYTKHSFLIIIIIEGKGMISANPHMMKKCTLLAFEEGAVFFVPAVDGSINIEGTCKILIVKMQ